MAETKRWTWLSWGGALRVLTALGLLGGTGLTTWTVYSNWDPIYSAVKTEFEAVTWASAIHWILITVLGGISLALIGVIGWLLLRGFYRVTGVNTHKIEDDQPVVQPNQGTVSLKQGALRTADRFSAKVDIKSEVLAGVKDGCPLKTAVLWGKKVCDLVVQEAKAVRAALEQTYLAMIVKPLEDGNTALKPLDAEVGALLVGDPNATVQLPAPTFLAALRELASGTKDSNKVMAQFTVAGVNGVTLSAVKSDEELLQDVLLIAEAAWEKLTAPAKK
jgi:hypothetical protein